MKRYIYILVLSLGLLLNWGQVAFATESDIKSNVTTEEVIKGDDYTFPLDAQPEHYSIYDYNDASVVDKILQMETTADVPAEKEASTISHNLKLSSDTVDFYPETNQYVAKNNVMLVIPEEKLQLTANEVIIDQRNFEIIGIGNVKIVKNNATYYGDYIRINTKKESTFFKNPMLHFAGISIDAKAATMYAESTVAEDGTALITKKINTVVSTSRFAGVLSEKFFDKDKAFDADDRNYKIVAKKILVKREPDRTDITFKKARIYQGKRKVAYIPNLTLASDKDVNYVETSFPEIGNRKKIGTFIAPSLVVPLPMSSSLKLGPLLSLDTHSDVGIGAFTRLSMPRGETSAMYSSNIKKVVIDGKYQLADNLRVQYVAHDYMEYGWMGGMMPNYGVELVYDTKNKITQANSVIRNRVSAGLFEDNKDYSRDPLTTLRYSWQVQANNDKPLLSWDRYLMLGYAYRHIFSLYQTGERTGIISAGPRLYTDLGRLFFDVRYYLAGEYGETPYKFDRYRYGQNYVRLHGQYYINKYLSLAYIATMNTDKKDYNNERLTESQLIAAIGTEDLKLRLGFDTVRNTTLVGVDMFLGSNKLLTEFEEMEVKNIDVKAQKKKSLFKRRKTGL